MANIAPVHLRVTVGQLALQLAIVAIALIGLPLAPPAQGEMLLMPIAPGAAAQLPALALRGDTRLIGSGRLRGSLIVRGRLGAIGWAMLAHGILPLASDAGGCTGGEA